MTCNVTYDPRAHAFVVIHWCGCQDAHCLATWEADRYNHDAAKMAAGR